MKNIHRIAKGGVLHAYITNEEVIKKGDWCINLAHKQIVKPTDEVWANSNSYNLKKIILTSDLELIKSGVQEIDSDSLEWIRTHENCSFVDVMAGFTLTPENTKKDFYYKIIIPTEIK